MSEIHFLTDQLAAQRIADSIAERAATTQRSRVPGVRRPQARHSLAQRLHRVAERLDV